MRLKFRCTDGEYRGTFFFRGMNKPPTGPIAAKVEDADDPGTFLYLDPSDLACFTLAKDLWDPQNLLQEFYEETGYTPLGSHRNTVSGSEGVWEGLS